MKSFKTLIPAIILGCLVALSFTGCDVTRQAKRASNLGKCEFRIREVEHVKLAGINFDNVKSVNDLNFMDAAQVIAGLTGPVFPLTLQVNVEGHNPNNSEAGLNRIEWILFIDDIRMTDGVVEQPVIIPPMGIQTIHVQVNVDLKQVLSGKPANAMVNFCSNLAGVGKQPTRFTVKLKPTIYVAGMKITYPGYITVKTEFTAL